MMMIPHNYLSFVKDADLPFDSSSGKAILEQLYNGVMLNEGKKKYWIDKQSNKNCFIIFPRALVITHGSNELYWKWETTKESRNGGEVELAVLLDVCWLDIKGTFRTISLSPGTLYEVVFLVKKRQNNYGWSEPVTVELTLPDEPSQKSTRSLKDYVIDQWTDVLVGEFTMSTTTVGEIAFSLTQTNGHWKKGMVFKGVAIRPKLYGNHSME